MARERDAIPSGEQRKPVAQAVKDLVQPRVVPGRLGRLNGRDGLLIGERYRLPVPPAPAFTLGNVIMTRIERDALLGQEALLAHEARHATQFAWCAGLVMLPLYFTAAGVSWVLTGDFGSRNIFERRAGLADGGYTDRPLRPALARWVATARRSQA